MDRSVEAEIGALESMAPRELRARWRDVFGEETRSGNRRYLIKRLAWRIQANAEGDISERARQRAEELANEADLRVRAPRGFELADGGHVSGHIGPGDLRVPMVGSVLTREYKGRTLRVTVLHDGFELDDEVYPSLTAVARAVTGSHWNGYHFFGLRGAS